MSSLEVASERRSEPVSDSISRGELKPLENLGER